MAEGNNKEAQPPLDLTLARAAAAFKDADFFESCILFWSAAFDLSSTNKDDDLLASLAIGLDLEQELGLDVQAEDPIDLVFPVAIANGVEAPHTINAKIITPIQTYILTALCYLVRHINVRIDILPSGQDTLTSLGPPQRYYISLTAQQKDIYHNMLAIVFATTSSIATTARLISSHDSQEQLTAWSQQLQAQQTTLLGNSATLSSWQTALSQKKTPHNLPRFFSYLNTSSCTVAGCSIPRNELDIDALEQAGFRLVITLIKESPLSASWFHHTQEGGQTIPKRIRNAFVPIENRKAPGFPEVFEVLMGWCVRADHADIYSIDKEQHQPEYHHQRASIIHCGGGKGRAGIILAAHLIRFGLLGHEGRGYCAECIQNGNLHQYNLEQFRKGLGDQGSVASTIPNTCSSIVMDLDSDEDNEEDEDLDSAGGLLRPVKRSQCLNRYKPMMAAKDAIEHLRELRPGSIESVEQEKAVKAYGDWLWKRSSSNYARPKSNNIDNALAHARPQPSNANGGAKHGGSDHAKNNKEIKKESAPKSKPVPAVIADDEIDDFSDDDFGRGRKSGKKGKKGSRKMPQEAPRVFVPPPPDKIIKIPGSQHHQHHLVVQHNLRAKQLQRGQKSKKNSGGGKHSKERPSYQVTGSPLISAPKLVVLAGLPGSGKSHLVTSLTQEFPDHFVRISQDELGSRAVCERLLAQSMRHQQQSLAARGPQKALPMTVFLDRCNPTMAERKEWYEVAFQPDEVAIFWFSRSVEHCIERVDAREGHPTVAQGMGFKVVNSFAKGFEFPNLAKEGSWCKTLVEIGDDEGSDRLMGIMKKFAKEIPSPSSVRSSAAGGEATQVRARPAFIPARVLQRKSNNAAGNNNEPGFDSPPSHSKLPSTGSMTIVEEEDEEDEQENETEKGSDEGDEKSSNAPSDKDGSSDENAKAKEQEIVTGQDAGLTTLASVPADPANMSISGALQFATLTGHRPAVKKPAKGSWKGSADTKIDTSASALANGLTSPKGVSFATPLSSYDRPLQKFPRTPHLFDPLTIRQSRQQGPDRVPSVANSADSDAPGVGRSAAISRSDLLLPPSALHQVFAPKPHQVLTIEEKMDGANIGFSVLHFKTMNGFAGISGSGPPPKIRIQNRNHFVHPDDHWQYKKLGGWLEKHREDILFLCEGRWRYESRKDEATDEIENEDEGDDDTELAEGKEDAVETDDGDEAWADEDAEDEDEEEYVDEDKVLQDGLAPYVLYGEWLYAKHSVQYTGLRSWFVPFDLFDVKTGTFVSRKLFRKAVAKTQLTPNPVIQIPKEIHGNVERTLDWTLKMLLSRSALMMTKGEKASSADVSTDQQQTQRQDRVEGLYFRIDQGDRLLMRSKVVRPDFIAGDERWGSKEQVANRLVPYGELLPEYDNEESEDD
ncbi:hypothetical protein BGX21_009266 [Mortierella sp. AD011]|nr:hypothetical protein BGX20_008773 [Mortierella sp. AD010]KAF9397098.1 hypothetical protein BGX21_009266 [Mortierella sp. AD011]